MQRNWMCRVMVTWRPSYRTGPRQWTRCSCKRSPVPGPGCRVEQPQPPSSVRFLCINSWVGGKPRWYTPGRRHPLLICLQDLLFIFSFVTIRGSWWQRNILLCGKSVPFASASAPTGCSYLLLVRRAQAIIEQYIFTHIISGKYCKRHADGTGGEKHPSVASISIV